MKALAFALKSLRRELRSGEVLVLLAAVTLAVAALTAVGFLTDRIGKAVARQANEVLAADLRLQSQEPIPASWRSLAADYELRTADMASFPSVVYRGDDNALSTLVAVGDGYPLRGTVRIADRLFGDEQAASGIPEAGTVWADGTLMARLGAEVGDVLEVGSARFPIAAVVTYRPDQSVGFASFAPRLLMNAADLPATELIGVGSRVTYALLVAGADAAVEDFAAAIEPELPDSLRLRSAEESSERAFAAADRAQRFLSLTAVISLLLSAVAIAMSARRFALRRMDPVALMKSLGATQGFVIGVATVQILLIGLIGVVAGCIIGYAVESAVSWVLADVISGDLPPAGLRPVVLACGSALLLLAGFALPSLIRLRNTPPLRVLRHDAMPPAPSRILVAGASLAAVAGLLYQSVGDAELLVYVLGGIILISAVLYLLGRGLVAALGRFRSGVGVAWRYGLANVARRGRASAVQVVAFGLGLTVLLLLTLVRTDLMESWRRTLDENAPNQFLINIQPDETDSVRRNFEERGIEPPALSPMVRARMTLINGETVKDRSFPDPGGEWFVNREQNLSWAAGLSDSNELLDGEWWPADYDGPPLVSIEEERSMETGLGVGDHLTFEVAGQTVEATIASVRKVNWDSFQPNFFLVFSPGALDDYPTTWIGSLRVEPEERDALVSLVRAHPTISVIDLDSVLKQVREIIQKATLAVQAVFVFTLAAGIAVLFAAVQSTIDERRFESAMLRALGAGQRTVLAGVMAEFAALGTAAGLLASAGASALAAVIAEQLFNLPYTFNPLLWVTGLGAGIVVVCASGYLAARGAINAAPVDVLRGAAA